MAIVLKGPYSGHFVTIKEFVGDKLVWRLTTQTHEFLYRLWRVDAPTIRCFKKNLLPDDALFPIRPGDLQETEEEEKEMTV